MKNFMSGFRSNRNLMIISTLIIIIFSSGIFLGFTPMLFNLSNWQGDQEFPDFITKNEDYFIVRIGNVAEINGSEYELKIYGFIDNPVNLSQLELSSLEMIEFPLTTESIGNPPNGPSVSTAVWKGFRIIDLLESLGLHENATGVRYLAADGYYASHTLSQLRANDIIGALYMNGVFLPPEQGFPLRIISPGSYGAKQPAWVTEIEIIDRPLEDYWDDRGWDTSPPMDVDSKIFFPNSDFTVKAKLGSPLIVGGAAYGGRRISKVEYSKDNGISWTRVTIVQRIDKDNVWVFWKAVITFDKLGTDTIYFKATDINGISQVRTDYDKHDGVNDWPSLEVLVV